MALFGFLKKKKAAKTHVKGLLALSAADGHVDPKELILIAAVAAREGLSSSEFQSLLDTSKNLEFTAPADDEMKLQYLKDMVSLMMVDGDINENEMALCKLVALQFGYRHEVIEALFLSIMGELAKKL